MSKRKIPIITGQIYHIYNRGIADQPIFSSVSDYYRFIELVNYYRFYSPDLRFSFFNRLSSGEKQKLISEMKSKKPIQIVIYAYCLMPNHFHFLVKEKIEQGIIKFFANLQNSYAHFYNVENKRKGSLFTEMFKNARVDNDEQFCHIARYIHLNPLTSYVIKRKEDLINYPWSSYSSYVLNSSSELLEKETLLSFFKSYKNLEKFTLDQSDYQRNLNVLYHLRLE